MPADQSDLVARFIACAALALGCANTWISYQKHRRERILADLNVGWTMRRQSARYIEVTVEIRNNQARSVRPLMLKARRPDGAIVIPNEAGGAGGPSSVPRVDLAPGWGLPFHDVGIEPDEEWIAAGAVIILEEYAAPTPSLVEVEIQVDLADGSRPQFFRFKKSL